MALDAKIVGTTSGTGVEVNASNQLKTTLETDNLANAANIGNVRIVSENDNGSVMGSAQLLSPETDLDYRLRVAGDTYLDNEIFNYTAQNTGKHQYTNTTMTNTWVAGAMTTNGSSITTTTTGTKFQTYAMFPVTGTSTLSVDIECGFSNTPQTNVVIDYGLFLSGAANPYAPTDGVYFRLSSAGMQGVLCINGTETTSSVMAFTVTPNKKNQMLVYLHQRVAEFWIGDPTTGDINLYATVQVPVGSAQTLLGGSVPFAVRHAIVGGAAGGVIQMQLGSYAIRLGGPIIARTLGELGNAVHGAYQGLSGGTMGSLANFANSANPSAVVPTNTTAAVGTGLGGQFWETDTLAVTTDGIICSYQVPAGTVNAAGRRLKVTGLKIQSFVQTALTGGGYNAVWSLAFGHTAVSLATAEAATTKAPRRVAVGVQTVASGAAALVMLNDVQSIDLADAPIYVNPGEFIAVVKKKVGTAPSAGTIAHNIQFSYAWE